MTQRMQGDLLIPVTVAAGKTEQLVALRKVSRAQSLSGHIAKRSRELGNKLDKVAAQVSDLETQRLKRRIELHNLVAELVLG